MSVKGDYLRENGSKFWVSILLMCMVVLACMCILGTMRGARGDTGDAVPVADIRQEVQRLGQDVASINDRIASGVVGCHCRAATLASGAPDSDEQPYVREPKPSLTPGACFPVTADDVCVPGYSSKVRNVTEAERMKVFREYGLHPDEAHPVEIDHLISLELGGSNDISNLWPEPYWGKWNAHDKDKLEDKLHRLVCSGTITLSEAQEAIRTDWIAAFEKYVGQ